MAQRFDWRSQRLEGEPVSIAPQVWSAPRLLVAGFAGFSISNSGLVAYRSGQFPSTPLVWFDRQGKRLETIGEPAPYSNPALSFDGKRLAVGRADLATGKRDIWILDLAQQTSSRFTFNPADEMNPAWSPDGSRIAFSSDRRGVRDIYVKSSSGAGEEELLLQSPVSKSVLGWFPDGGMLAYSNAGQIWRVTSGAERKPAVLIGESRADQASISPDGKWIAYHSLESGQSEIYVQSVAAGGGKWQISTSGGREPYWRGDGKELFYLNGNDMMTVAIHASAAGVEKGTPVKLFVAPAAAIVGRNRFVAAPDGQRFLIITANDQVSAEPIEIVLNWQGLLKH
jgi:Tol biopolymer transport system component